MALFILKQLLFSLEILILNGTVLAILNVDFQVVIFL